MPYPTWMPELGEQIRQARENKKLTQDALAEKVNKSRATINSYENGRGNPEFQVIVEIADLLDHVFTVRGCKIGPEDVVRATLAPAEQLCLEFDQDHTYLATLTIRPSQKSVTITANAKVEDKLA